MNAKMQYAESEYKAQIADINEENPISNQGVYAESDQRSSNPGQYNPRSQRLFKTPPPDNCQILSAVFHRSAALSVRVSSWPNSETNIFNFEGLALPQLTHSIEPSNRNSQLLTYRLMNRHGHARHHHQKLDRTSQESLTHHAGGTDTGTLRYPDLFIS